jgi:hypothetical protein
MPIEKNVPQSQVGQTPVLSLTSSDVYLILHLRQLVLCVLSYIRITLGMDMIEFIAHWFIAQSTFYFVTSMLCKNAVSEVAFNRSSKTRLTVCGYCDVANWFHFSLKVVCYLSSLFHFRHFIFKCRLQFATDLYSCHCRKYVVALCLLLLKNNWATDRCS